MVDATADAGMAGTTPEQQLADASAVGCRAQMDPRSGTNSLVATRPFNPGEVITPFSAASRHTEPTVWTVQIDESEHVELAPTQLRYCNHSCDPNCFFDVDAYEFVALRDINAGDELTFFYPSTEWDMHQPFDCHCGSTVCLGEVTGAASTPREALARYRVSNFIRGRLAASNRR